MDIRRRVDAVRAQMSAAGLDAYIIPSSDPHQSEYPPSHWAGRAWISGFTGSAGTVVVTNEGAYLWTDFRYYTQAEQNLAGTGIELFRFGGIDVPDYPDWLARELDRGGTVGFDAATFSVAATRRLSAALEPRGITVVAGVDLLDAVWNDRPPLPAQPIFAHDQRYTGQSRGEKISMVRTRMQSLGATHHLISTLDDIAWLLNLRGSDVEYNPVFLSYALLTIDRVLLFVDASRLPPDLGRDIESDGVTVEPYDSVSDVVGRIGPGSVVLYSLEQTSAALASTIADGVARVERTNPSTEMKARKTSTEIEHLRQTMIRDGEAMARFLHWLSTSVRSGERISEIDAEVKLREFRMREERFVSESFHTISGYRGHGAIVHYSATPTTASRLEPAGLYLIDSGGQYHDGTTDITRTIALGEPGADERRDFTRVLQAHIALATLTFPVGTSGHMIDAVCRQRLWAERMNYGHGTGHGVGFFLNVHEGPHRISSQPNTVALEPGMLISNEPGLYRPERYGIRTENLVLVVDAGTSEFGAFLRFETLTLCPIDRSLIDTALMSARELAWVDEYHRTVRERVLGRLDGAAATWLEEACAPLG